MRKTIRPVTLSRIIEMLGICQEDRKIREEDARQKLKVSKNRLKEIMNEMKRISLIEAKGDISLTSTGEKVWDNFLNENWKRIHEILFEYSPHYHTFIKTLEELNGETGLTEKELLKELSDEDELKFNKTSISLLTDWAERLNIIQRNVFENRFYRVGLSNDLSFVEALKEEYSNLEHRRGLNLRERYISIPKLRERVCEKLSITRDKFDRLLVEIYMENIGNMELSGAPLDTQAKESRLAIKSMEKDDKNDLPKSKMSSERVLRGVEMNDGRVYYYISIFENLRGEKNE